MTEVRRHLSDQISRERVTLELRRGRGPAAVVVVGLLVAAAIAVYIGTHVTRTALRSTQEIHVAVDDATGVVAGIDEVRFKGIAVGTVVGVKAAGTHPILTLRVQRKYGALYRDARAALRPTTALQDMYLDILDRGSPAAGPLRGDAVLASGQTAVSVNPDDVLNVFRADERAKLGALLDNLGNGLAHRGARLRLAFAELVPLLQVAGRVSDQLGQREPLTRRLVHNVGLLTGELARRDRQLRQLIKAGGATAETLQAGAGDLDATLRLLPGTLHRIDSSFGAVSGVLPDVDRAVDDLRPVASRLSGDLATVRRLNVAAAPAVRALRPPARDLRPLVGSIKPLAARLDDAVGSLAPQADTIDLVTRRVAGCKVGLQGFFQWDMSMSKFGDSRGHIPRGNLVLGPAYSGFAHGPDELAAQACTPGGILGGRPGQLSDGH